jgi:L-alanine-DL-glutamate epimerase-like enolase superfamily enzyme
MKITDVKAYPLAILRPKDEVYPPSRISARRVSHNPPMSWTGDYTVYVEILTDEGITGLGQCHSQGGYVEATTRIIDGGVIPYHGGLKRLLIGKDPFDVFKIWETMFNSMRTLASNNYGGFFIEAISGIDMALWDIIGKAVGKPIHKMIGGKFRDWIKCYGYFFLGDTIEESVKSIESMMKDGYKVGKCKVAYRSPESFSGPGIPISAEEVDYYDYGNQYIEHLRACREVAGPDFEIGVDANCGFELAAAKHFGRELEKLGIMWFEEPLPPDDLKGYILLQRTLNLYIAGGESWQLRYGFKPFIDNRAVDIIQPDIKLVGGISEAVRLAWQAHLNHILYQPHTTFVEGPVSLAAELQVSAAIPNFIAMELGRYPGFCSNVEGPVRNPLRDDPRIYKAPITEWKDGYLRVPNKPGLGVEIDLDYLVEKYLVENLVARENVALHAL